MTCVLKFQWVRYVKEEHVYDSLRKFFIPQMCLILWFTYKCRYYLAYSVPLFSCNFKGNNSLFDLKITG